MLNAVVVTLHPCMTGTATKYTTQALRMRTHNHRSLIFVFRNKNKPNPTTLHYLSSAARSGGAAEFDPRTRAQAAVAPNAWFSSGSFGLSTLSVSSNHESTAMPADNSELQRHIEWPRHGHFAAGHWYTVMLTKLENLLLLRPISMHESTETGLL